MNPNTGVSQARSMRDRLTGSRPRPDRRAFLVVVLGLMGIYLSTMGGHSYSVDGESSLAATRALLHHSTVVRPGPDLDAVVVAVLNKNGSLTTIAPIGTLALFAPGAVAGAIVSRVFPDGSREEVFRLIYFSANSVMTALTAGLLLLLCRRLGARLRSAVLLSVVFGLGTWAWQHSKTDFSEPGTALMLTAALLVSVRWWTSRSAKDACLVGLLAGCVGLTRSSTLLFVPIFLLAGLLGTRQTVGDKSRSAAAFCAGGIGPGIAFAVFAWLKFGSPLDNGYPNLPYSTPIYEGIFGQFLSPGKGVLVYAPVCIVVVFASRLTYIGNRRYALTALAVLVAHLAVYSRFMIWSGENAFGPRYMVPLLPMLVALLAPVIDSAPRWTRGVQIAGLVGFLVPGLLGSMMYFNGVYFARQNELLRDMQTESIPAAQQYFAWDFLPRTSPLMQTIRSVPDLVRNSVDRLEGHAGGITPIPPNYEDRIHWYARSVELDTWWAWWSSRDDPAGAYLLLIIPAACLIAAGTLALGMSPSRRARPATTIN